MPFGSHVGLTQFLTHPDGELTYARYFNPGVTMADLLAAGEIEPD